MTLDDFLKKGYEIPSLPEVYLKISQLLEDESVSAEKIGNAVQTDPAIASRLLKMVNSAYYGLPNQVSSIAQSVALLGRLRLKHILIGSVLNGVFRDTGGTDFPLEEFWQHSIRTALIARKLGSDSRVIDEPDTLFTAGLLHDIGRLILSSKVENYATRVEEIQIRERVSIIKAEQELIGFDHGELASALIKEWQMPDDLVDAVRNHHDSNHAGPYADESEVIYLASELANRVPPIDEEETIEMLEDIPNWQSTGLSIEQISEACQMAEEMVFEVMESLGMVDIVLSD